MRKISFLVLLSGLAISAATAKAQVIMRQKYVAMQFPSLKNAEGVSCPQKNPDSYQIRRAKVLVQNQGQEIVLKTADKDTTKKETISDINAIIDQKQD